MSVVIAIAAIGAASTGRAQVYQIAGATLNGYTEFLLSDWGNGRYQNSYGGRSSGIYIDDTISVDPASQTVRQFGTIWAGFTLDDLRTVNRTIGGSTVSASVSVHQWSGDYNGITFDTGARPYVWDASLGVFTFDGRLLCSSTINGSYSLATGGETFAGNFSYNIGGSVYGYTQFSPETTITVIDHTLTFRTFSGWGIGPSGDILANTFSGGTAVNVTAANGFQLFLRGGLNDGLDFFRATANPASAYLIPEPSVLTLSGAALVALVIYRERRRGGRNDSQLRKT